jgi:hypothetical protein
VDDELVVAVGVAGQDHVGWAPGADAGQQPQQVLAAATGDAVVQQVLGAAALDEDGVAVVVVAWEPQPPFLLHELRGFCLGAG